LIEAQILERAEFLKYQIDTLAAGMCENLNRKTKKIKRYFHVFSSIG
jgi:hypothetical protein